MFLTRSLQPNSFTKALGLGFAAMSQKLGCPESYDVCYEAVVCVSTGALKVAHMLVLVLHVH